MLAGYQNREPDSISAGDTVQFGRYFLSYPASQGWYLSYSIIGLGAEVNFQSVANGDAHAVTVSAATTATWLPAKDSKLAGYIVNNALGERREIYYEDCPIYPNLQDAPPDQPALTFNQQCLAALQQLYLTKGNDDLLLAHVGDSTFRFESKKEIFDQICILQAHCRTDDDRERAKNGKPSRRRMIPVVGITAPGPLFSGQFPSPFIGGN